MHKYEVSFFRAGKIFHKEKVEAYSFAGATLTAESKFLFGYGITEYDSIEVKRLS